MFFCQLMKKILVSLLLLATYQTALCQDAANCISFNDFIASFPEWRKGNMEDKTSINMQGEDLWGESLMKAEVVERFIPRELIDTCGCEKGNVAFNYGYKITKGKCYICFMTRHCDTPNIGCFPYIDDIMVTYRKDGRIIDYAQTSRLGDLWHYDVRELDGYEDFVVAQASYDLKDVWEGNYISLDGKLATVQIKNYQVSKEGKITNKLVETFKTTSTWNGKDYDIDNLNKHKFFHE